MGNKTVYDINPNAKEKYIKIEAKVKCEKCKRFVIGDLILDREGLTVTDTSNFLIFKDPVCDECSKDFRKDFGNTIKDVCNEMGVTPEGLGIEIEKT
jgi:hypothetical protein